MSDSSKTADKKLGIPGAIALTTASALLSFANGAAAQDSTPTDAMPEGAESIEEVVVTGFRASLNKALDAKQAQVGAIDMIVAEDIADFPDLNLAESLQRVPGVVIARDAGEGRQISVRGLGPQFTRVRINGIEAMSANGSTDASGGTNRARNFDFNTFASELFNTITVRKTASADTEEGSLGATVDLRTGRPFDYDGFTIAGGAQLGYNDLNGETDPRATFLVSNTFADGKFGALLSVAYTDRQLSDDGASTVRWQNNGFVKGTNGNPDTPGSAAANFANINTAVYTGPITTAQLNQSFRPRIPRVDKYEHDQQRLGVTGALQFAPSDATSISLDMLYADFKAKRNEIFLEVPVFSTNGAQGINNVDFLNGQIDPKGSGAETGTLVYGVFDDVDIRSESRHDELETRFYQFTLDGKHSFSDSVTLHALAGFAEANHDNPIQTTLLWDHDDVDGFSYDYRDNSRLPLITYGTTDVTNPTTWRLTQIRLRPQSTLNSYQSASFDVEWKATDSWTFKVGPDWKNYIFKSTEERRAVGEGTIPAVANGTNAPIATYSRIVTLDTVDLPSGSVTTWLSPDMGAATTALHLDDPSVYPMNISSVLGNNYVIEEDDLGGFVQADFNYELGGHTLRGNVGARYVQTDQTSKGWVTAGTATYTTVKRSYDDVLPSLNLVYDVSESLLLRLGAAEVMTRPNLANLSPGSTVSVSGNNRTVSQGNPNIDPFRAKAYDLGVEWYFAPESLVSVAYFFKDVDSFVQTLRDTRPFTGNPYGLPVELAIQACGNTVGCTPDALWDFTVPISTPGGDVKGFEIAYQQPFSFLPGVWSNFGTILNYTHVESEITYLTPLPANTPLPNPDDPLDPANTLEVTNDLTGLSKDAYNATLYFDNKTFSARVSAAYRSDYLTTVPGRNGNDVEGTASTLNIDFSSSYNINDNLTVSLEGLNLTDEAQDQWVDEAGNRSSYYHLQGRQYFVGVRFKY